MIADNYAKLLYALTKYQTTQITLLSLSLKIKKNTNNTNNNRPNLKQSQTSLICYNGMKSSPLRELLLSASWYGMDRWAIQPSTIRHFNRWEQIMQGMFWIFSFLKHFLCYHITLGVYTFKARFI